MNNFEQRLLLSYLSKLINVIDLRSYAFDDLFDFFLNAVKTTKMIGGNADDFEGVIENVAKVVAKKKVVKEQKDKTTEDYNINLVNADIDLKDL